jgi:SWI/SNF related-matrix-associated actin-dependent regulator of chromatin subfamily C
MQFQKMQVKMSFLSEVENLVLPLRELIQRTRKKLTLERREIASAIAATVSRTNQHGAPGTARLPLPVALVQQLRRP